MCTRFKDIATFVLHHATFSQATSPRREISGRLGVRWKKVGCWSTKAAISLKRAKIEENLLWRAYRNSPTLVRTVTSPTHYMASSSPRLVVCNPQNFNRYYFRNGKKIWTSNLKFGSCIHRVHPNKSPSKFWRKGSLGVPRDCPNFLNTPYYVRNG